MADQQISDAIEFLRQTLDQVKELTCALDRQQQIWKPPDERFSILENVCHLRDIETEGYAVRIQRILTEESPTLHDIDGARLAIERQYNTTDMETALNEFLTARISNLRILQNLSNEKLERGGNLEN